MGAKRQEKSRYAARFTLIMPDAAFVLIRSSLYPEPL